jgi:hypothetical protein
LRICPSRPWILTKAVPYPNTAARDCQALGRGLPLTEQANLLATRAPIRRIRGCARLVASPTLPGLQRPPADIWLKSVKAWR